MILKESVLWLLAQAFNQSQKWYGLALIDEIRERPYQAAEGE
jgi:hypothetical protein